ncbi:helix-turn-helix domain-containing protein [Streptomyces sp. NPDC127190]|uniref:helix-turn-helix domain-containing protein n=1 Tax=unclassified Streptomyces TaxID=2593676 RepID=UPI003627B618
MPGATEAFARLLRELKDRSGLSYGTLAKRLHMSASTLHRYCSGAAVPVEYAPVERLARLCRATPEELVELHRRWILADASRSRRTDQPPAPDPAPAPPEAGEVPDEDEAIEDDGQAGAEDSGDEGSARTGTTVGEETPPRRPFRLRQRRTVLIASVAVAAALGAVLLTVRPQPGDGSAAVDRRAAAPAEESARPTATTSEKPSAHPTASSTPAPASPSPTRSGTAKDDHRRPAPPPNGDSTGGAVPLTVGTRPYVYDSPCSQHFLVDSEPAQVGPPAGEENAPRWTAAYGAVASDEQRVGLTVQGTGADTVVLEALHVRVLAKGAPLAWNDYSMGVGCGGGVETESFDIDLDDGSPTVTVKNGQRDFPYKVSESDPEVFYVTAHTRAHDVRWDLSLDWSSGARHGTVHIDNAGTPFRTSADVGRPGYDYPLGSGEWIKRTG